MQASLNLIAIQQGLKGSEAEKFTSVMRKTADALITQQTEQARRKKELLLQLPDALKRPSVPHTVN